MSAGMLVGMPGGRPTKEIWRHLLEGTYRPARHAGMLHAAGPPPDWFVERVEAGEVELPEGYALPPPPPVEERLLADRLARLERLRVQRRLWRDTLDRHREGSGIGVAGYLRNPVMWLADRIAPLTAPVTGGALLEGASVAELRAASELVEAWLDERPLPEEPKHRGRWRLLAACREAIEEQEYLEERVASARPPSRRRLVRSAV